MFKKILLTMFLLTCALFVPAHAQTDAAAEKRLAVKEFYKLMIPDAGAIDLNEQINVQAEETGKMVVVLVSSEYQSLNPEQLKILQDIVSKKQAEISKRLRDKLAVQFNLDKYVDEVFEAFYDEYLTLDELKSALIFYKSSAGKKMRTMNKALDTYAKQKILDDFIHAVWRADADIRPALQKETGLKFREEMLKTENPPIKIQ